MGTAKARVAAAAFDGLSTAIHSDPRVSSRAAGTGALTRGFAASFHGELKEFLWVGSYVTFRSAFQSVRGMWWRGVVATMASFLSACATSSFPTDARSICRF